MSTLGATRDSSAKTYSPGFGVVMGTDRRPSDGRASAGPAGSPKGPSGPRRPAPGAISTRRPGPDRIESGNTWRQSVDCPGLSWCQWLRYRHFDMDAAASDWAMYWSRHLHMHQRRLRDR